MRDDLLRRALLAWDTVLSRVESLRLSVLRPRGQRGAATGGQSDPPETDSSAESPIWTMLETAVGKGAAVDELSEAVNKVAAAHATIVVRELQRTAPRMLREHRAIARGMRRRMRAIWGPAFDSLYQVYVCAEEIGSTLSRHQPADDALTQALLGLHARACLILAELHSLCSQGFPLGAWARARSLQETAVIAGVLSEYGREAGLEDFAERFLAHAVMEELRDLQAAQKSGLAVDSDEMQAVQQEATEARGRYGPGFGGSYGWARPLFPARPIKQRLTYSDLAELYDSGLDPLDYRLGSHHVHATAWTVELNAVQRGTTWFRLTGPVNIGFTEPVSVALAAMVGCVHALVFGVADSGAARDLLGLHALAQLAQETVEKFAAAQEEVDRREERLVARLEPPRRGRAD